MAHDGLGLILEERQGYDGDRYRALLDRQGETVLGFYVSLENLGLKAFRKRAPAGTAHCDIVPVYTQGELDASASVSVNGVDRPWMEVLDALRGGIAAMESADAAEPKYIQVRYLRLGE